jgi:hypothetical protein
MEYIKRYEALDPKSMKFQKTKLLSEADLKYAYKLEMPDRFMQDQFK